MLFQRPLYPFLLSLYVVFFVFSENLGEAFVGQIGRSIGVLLLLTGLLLLLLTRVFRSRDRGAFVTALILALIYMHFGLRGLVAEPVPGELNAIGVSHAAPAWIE